MSNEITQINAQLLDPTVVKTMGAGRAYQSVATSMAITVQDATDYLRTSSVVCQAGIAALTAQYVATDGLKPPNYEDNIQALAQTMEKSIGIFTKMGEAAAKVLEAFPSS
ncbi:MAG: hypothetical protein QNJ55_33270 [Xenococcus sp. MO_188.B8]|nr:hypothetical protein [Xenococcus sp. MO_188.B8]